MTIDFTGVTDPKPKRGFGSPSYDKEKQRRIASSGGRAAHQKGTAYEFNSETAKAARAKQLRKVPSGTA